MATHRLRTLWLTGIVAATGCAQESQPASERPAANPPAQVSKPVTPPASGSIAANTSANTDAQAVPEAPIRAPETVPATAAPSTSEAPAITLGIGSPAPPLALASWTKGEPFSAFEPGQIYVVEFWATWCGPCKVSMPHLSQLQTEMGESVRFVGISDEPEETVRSFLDSPYAASRNEEPSDKTWNDVVQYSLARDDNRKTNAAYMQAAGQNGIPTAFVVGADGVIEWIGHPMAMDEPLAQIRSGSWDRTAAIAKMEEEKRAKVAMRTAQSALRKAMATQDWNAAVTIMDDLITQFPDNPQLKYGKLSYLSIAGRQAEADKLIDELVTSSWDNADGLNELAWAMATKQLPGPPELALKSAQRAVELTREENASHLDTLARVHFEQGRVDDALVWQRKAVAIDSGTPQIVEALTRYEAAKNGTESEEVIQTPPEPPVAAPAASGEPAEEPPAATP